MTKKEFQLIAAVLAGASTLSKAEHSFLNALVNDFANALSTTNPRFKRDLFVQAATGQVSVTARKARDLCDLPSYKHGVKEAERFARSLASDLAEDR